MRTILFFWALLAFKANIYANANAPVLDSLPVIICPPDLTLNTSDFNCSTSYTYPVKVEDDTSGWLLVQTAGLSSGAEFSLGATLNAFLVTDLDGNTAACSFTVQVVDSSLPICVPPAEVVVSCEQFDPALTAYGVPTISDNCCVDHQTNILNFDQFDTLCNRGTLTRIFQAFDCSGNSSFCSQRIVVNYEQNYYIRFPDDTLATVCNPTNIYGMPVIYGENCELLSVTYEDEIYGLPVIDACFKIERTWTIINGCTYLPNLPLTNVPNPSLVNTPYTIPVNNPGPVVSDCNAAGAWAPTLSKISPSDTIKTNYCSFWSANANGYRYKQIVKILDLDPPVFDQCSPNTTFADSTENNPELWNNVFNPALPAQNLSETAIDLSITSTDNCSGASIYLHYQLYLDLDGDGVQETVVLSDNFPSSDSIHYGNVPFPGFAGGTARAFDNRSLPANQKWRFAVQNLINGNHRTASVRWNTAQSPTAFSLPELPAGNHKIKWFSSDGCGNESICEIPFTILPSTVVGIQAPEQQSFALFQNEPNPFVQQTLVRFSLAEVAQVNLSIFDMSGRMLFRQTAEYGPGAHAIRVEQDQLGTSGLLYYQLEAGTQVAWKKMMLFR